MGLAGTVEERKQGLLNAAKRNNYSFTLLDNKWKKKEPISKCDCDMPQCQMGSKESLVSLLQQGHLVGLSPGGTYEAQMGDNMYKLMWRARTGFAR